MENKERIENLQAIEPILPNPDIIQITKCIIQQNGTILRMNERLLTIISSPLLLCKGNEK